MRRLVIAADDRTGALEVAAACADRDGQPVVAVPFGERTPDDAERVVVDLGSRHLAPAAAAARAAATIDLAAQRHAHKIDSALRGNWPAEVAGRLAAGRAVLVAALPAAGRVCRDGEVVVVVDGLATPVHVAMANDPRGAPANSRPGELLAAAGVRSEVVTDAAGLVAWLDAGRGGVAVCDAATAADLEVIGPVAAAQDVLLIGTAPAIAASIPLCTGAALASRPAAREVLAVCGSLARAARAQLAKLGRADLAGVRIMATADVSADDLVSPAAAEAAAAELAGRVARSISDAPPDVVIVLGGDTAAAVLGSAPMAVVGSLAPGTALSRRLDGSGPWFVTRAGSFGDDDALVSLVHTLRS